MKITKTGDLNLDKKIRELEKFAESGELAEEAKEFFLLGFPVSNSYVGGGQTNASKNGWADRKKPYDWPTLQKSGYLKDSIKSDKNSVYTNCEYASYHNDGVPGNNLPQREFIGDSRKLDKQMKKSIIEKLNKIMK